MIEIISYLKPNNWLTYWLLGRGSGRICWLHLYRLERAHQTSDLGILLNCIWWWASNPGAVGNVENPFIAITSMSTLIQGSIYGSNKTIQSFIILETVAERISHFCLVRNLIQPLGSTHNFTQSGWLILFHPDHLSGQHKLGKSAKHFLFSELHSVQTSYCLLFNSSSSITPPWGKQSNLWIPCVYFS